jgi:hypothetical protein
MRNETVGCGNWTVVNVGAGVVAVDGGNVFEGQSLDWWWRGQIVLFKGTQSKAHSFCQWL